MGAEVEIGKVVVYNRKRCPKRIAGTALVILADDGETEVVSVPLTGQDGTYTITPACDGKVTSEDPQTQTQACPPEDSGNQTVGQDLDGGSG